MGLTVNRRRLEQLKRRGSQRPRVDLLASDLKGKAADENAVAVALVRLALADGRREVARPIADAAIGLDNVKKLRELQDTETMREAAEYNIYI